MNAVSDYISNQPEYAQKILNEIRHFMKSISEEITEKISYQTLTFFLNSNLVHFAIFKNHIGFYPTPSAILAFKNELANYKTEKGTIRFPLDEDLPYELIKKIVLFRIEENIQRYQNKKNKASI